MPDEASKQRQFTEDDLCGGTEAMSPLLNTDLVDHDACGSRQPMNVFDASFVGAVSQSAGQANREVDLEAVYRDRSDASVEDQAMPVDLKDIPCTEAVISLDRQLDSGQEDINTESSETSAHVVDGDSDDTKTIEGFVSDVMNNAITEWLSSDTKGDAVTDANQDVKVAVSDVPEMGNASETDAACLVPEDLVSRSLMESAQIEQSHEGDDSVPPRSQDFIAASQTEETIEGYGSNRRDVMETTVTGIQSSVDGTVVPEREIAVEEGKVAYEDDEVFTSDASSVREHSVVFPQVPVHDIVDNLSSDVGAVGPENTLARAFQPEDSHGLEGGDGPVACGGTDSVVLLGQCDDVKDGDLELKDLQQLQMESSCNDNTAFVYSESDSSEASSTSDDDNYRPQTSHGHYVPLSARPNQLDVTKAEDLSVSPKELDDSGDRTMMSQDPCMRHVVSGGDSTTAEVSELD